MWRKLLVAAGSMCALYACIELARLIFIYAKNVAWVSGFGVELVMLAVGIIWIIVSLIDDLFIKRNILGGK